MEMILGLIINALYFLLGISVGLAVIIILVALISNLKDK